MFKSLGRAFKKMFTKKPKVEKKVIHISDTAQMNSGRGGSNYTSPKTISNRIKRWRAKNKVARQSRNEQHRRAA